MPLLDPRVLLSGKIWTYSQQNRHSNLSSVLNYFTSDLTDKLHGMRDVIDATVLGTPDPADVRGVGVENPHLQPQATGDDLVPAAEVLPAALEHHVPVEHLHLDP